MRKILIVAATVLATNWALAQEAPAQGDLNAATQAMSHGHHHDHEHLDAHMHMSTLRDRKPGDRERAQKVVDQVKPALERYRDYNNALADGYKIFLPNVPQKMYHFTNWMYAMGAAFTFDPTKPTSLLYEKHGNDFKLIGAMYTAPVRFTEEQLNERVPLSVAQWHQHVNMCKPPQGREMEMLGKRAKFGLAGSISTRQACEAAGGTFMPHVFGWMVHVYPWEKTPDEIWSVERQLKDKAANNEDEHHDHGDMAGRQIN
jgi:G3E family GTPase